MRKYARELGERVGRAEDANHARKTENKFAPSRVRLYPQNQRVQIFNNFFLFQINCSFVKSNTAEGGVKR